MKDLPVLLIDNRSAFCSKTMQLIYRSGGYDKFNFLSIYSEESKLLLNQYGLTTNGEQLLVLVENEELYTKSGAVLQAARKLKGIVPMLYWFIIVPQKYRDSFYDKLSGKPDN